MKDKTIKNAMNGIEKIIRDVYSQGYNDGIEFSNEAHACTGDYECGLNDAWECARKMMLSDEDGGIALSDILKIFGMTQYSAIKRFSASEAIAKIKEYEEKQKQEEIGCKTCAYSEHGEDGFFKCHAKGDCLNHEKWTPKMTIDEAITYGKEQLEVFGGEHREFIEIAIKALNQEWILTSERPPEIDDEVIAYDGADAFVAWYGVNGWHSNDNRFDPRIPIIKWKPINLPKAEEKTNDSCWKEYYESKFMRKV